MLIENKKEGLVMIPNLVKNDVIGMVRLVPGWTYIDSKIWNCVRSHVADKIGKQIEELTDKSGKPLSLDDLDEKAAIALVSETFDLPTLDYFLENENRISVRAVITQQVGFIHAGHN